MQKEVKPLANEIAQHETVRRTLLAGLFAKKIMPIRNSIHWEELTCLGYDPLLSKLEAIVSIKRSTGFSGNLCTKGTTEYVRFFVDWGDGSGFRDVGLTSFKAADIPDAPPGPQHPLKYMISMPLDDESHRRCCHHAVLPKVRAILSWNQVPSNDPNFVPIFGNRLDANIQIQPKHWTLACLLEEKIVGAATFDKDLFKKLKLDTKATLPLLKPGPLPWIEIMPKYKEAGVPNHRPAYATAQALIKGEATSAKNLQMSSKDIVDAQIDLDEVMNMLSKDKANVTFEELVCLGGFIRYNESLFSWNDQKRLAAAARNAVERGIHVLVSNAQHESVRRLYRGFTVGNLSRASCMAGDPGRRGRTSEYLFMGDPKEV